MPKSQVYSSINFDKWPYSYNVTKIKIQNISTTPQNSFVPLF